MTPLAVTLCLAAYLLGSVPTGLYVARAKGIDLRKVGSGNIGATNVARALGRRWAVLVLLCDAAKGALPVLAGRLLGVPRALVALAGLLAIGGHVFSFLMRGRGGKGVATSLGVALTLSPIAALCSFGVYAVCFVVLRYSSVGSLLGAWLFPVFAHFVGGLAREEVLVVVAAAVLVTVRHKDNIRRVLKGEEKRA